MQRLPSVVPLSTIAAAIGELRLDAEEWEEPGLRSVAHGSGVIMMPPDSVCDHVSTIGQPVVADHVLTPFPHLAIDRLSAYQK